MPRKRQSQSKTPPTHTKTRSHDEDYVVRVRARLEEMYREGFRDVTLIGRDSYDFLPALERAIRMGGTQPIPDFTVCAD